PDRKILTPFLVAVYQHFGIGMVGGEAVPDALELGSQLELVVDLAVEHDAHVTSLVPHRLLAASDVDDRQPAMAKKHMLVLVDEFALAIRPAMNERRHHAGQVVARPCSGESTDTAHRLVGLTKIDELAHAVGGASLRLEVRAHHDLSEQPHH